MIRREDIFQYVKDKYGIEEDYPFQTAPTYPVMRHEDNRKWFALIMDIPKNRLGLKGKELVDVINVKQADPLLADFLIRQDGFFRGYHMGGNWISILLDGTVSFEEVCHWIDESYLATASKRKKQKNRSAKEWIVPANPKYYDIEGAFSASDEIDWKQGAGIRAGDTVYMYIAAPVSAIMYACRVTETGIPYSYADENLTITALMKIRLLKRYRPEEFPFETLKTEYGIFAVRGPRGVPHALSEALRKSGANEEQSDGQRKSE